jgi:hypothetical protein
MKKFILFLCAAALLSACKQEPVFDEQKYQNDVKMLTENYWYYTLPEDNPDGNNIAYVFAGNIGIVDLFWVLQGTSDEILKPTYNYYSIQSAFEAKHSIFFTYTSGSLVKYGDYYIKLFVDFDGNTMICTHENGEIFRMKKLTEGEFYDTVCDVVELILSSR